MHYTCNCKIICVKYFLQTLYSDWVVKDRRNITAILEDLPSVKPPIDHLCELLPRLQARYYSISSSPKVRTLKGDAMSALPFLLVLDIREFKVFYGVFVIELLITQIIHKKSVY